MQNDQRKSGTQTRHSRATESRADRSSATKSARTPRPEPAAYSAQGEVAAPAERTAAAQGTAPVADPAIGAETIAARLRALLAYVVVGALFGLALTKGEAIAWYRIQEMLRFQSFHLFGVLGSAVIVAGISLRVIRRLGIRARDGQPIVVPPKTPGPRYAIGGIIFGLGWGLVGACPGPFFTLIGTGASVMVVALVSAAAGTWVYAHVRPKLPH